MTANRDRPRSWGWLITVVAMDFLVVLGGSMMMQNLITDPGWAGRRSVYLAMAVVLFGTAVYVVWRSRRTDWDRREGR